MAGISPNFKKRSFLLPPGCKDLADVLNGNRPRKPALAGFCESGMIPLGSLRVNGQITAESVRVKAGSTELGIMPLAEALELAKSKQVDLVELNREEPPLCLLIGYGEFRHKQAEFLKRWQALWETNQ